MKGKSNPNYKHGNRVKGEYPCSLCGVLRVCELCGVDNLPLCCYQFHHKDPLKKDVNIGVLFTVGNYDKIKKELDKCELLCANCHMIRHWGDD